MAGGGDTGKGRIDRNRGIGRNRKIYRMRRIDRK